MDDQVKERMIDKTIDGSPAEGVLCKQGKWLRYITYRAVDVQIKTAKRRETTLISMTLPLPTTPGRMLEDALRTFIISSDQTWLPARCLCDF